MISRSLLSRALLLLFYINVALAQDVVKDEDSSSPVEKQDNSLDGLPIIDLGYARYRATALNVSHDICH